MSVLYLVEQGATLRKQADTFLVTKNSQDLQTIPASKVGQVVIFGNVNITTPAIHYLLRNGIDCVFCSSVGRYHGRLFSTESKFGLLRRSQLEVVDDDRIKLSVATQFIRGKLTNQRTFLQRYQRKEGDADLKIAVETLEDALGKLDLLVDIDSLQGVEGHTGAAYFAAFRRLLKQDLGFAGRVKRPPRDPVNSLLSLGYTLLVYDAQSAIRTVGLDPFIGFLHSTEYSKPSLALDLIEEFRTIIVDSTVLRLINNNVLKSDDFSRRTDIEGTVLLTQEALKTFIQYYEERLLTEIIHPESNTKVNYRRCLELQARQIVRVVTGRSDEYRPFLVK